MCHSLIMVHLIIHFVRSMALLEYSIIDLDSVETGRDHRVLIGTPRHKGSCPRVSYGNVKPNGVIGGLHDLLLIRILPIPRVSSLIMPEH